MSNITPNENRFFLPFLRLVTVAGCLAFSYAVYNLELRHLDLRFAFLLSMSLLLTTRIVIPIPRLSSLISVSDTFVFLILLSYGGPAAIIVASAEAFYSSLIFSRKPQTYLFNSSRSRKISLCTPNRYHLHFQSFFFSSPLWNHTLIHTSCFFCSFHHRTTCADCC